MKRPNIPEFEANNHLHVIEDLVTKISDGEVKLGFECLMNNKWVPVPPSLAAYDVGWGGSLRAVAENLRRGSCLQGASGTMYRLSSSQAGKKV